MENVTMEKSDLAMLESCYAYDQLDSKYCEDLKTKYGDYTIQINIDNLRRKYEIKHNVYEDSEGCAYNSLIERR
jgi:hypothetical protein